MDWDNTVDVVIYVTVVIALGAIGSGALWVWLNDVFKGQ